MVTLGISVYPDIRPLDEIAAYLRRAARYGYTRVFTSMFSVAGASSEVLALFDALIGVAHECGMAVSLDINPACMKRLGATPSNLSVFSNLHADILRMDGAYGEDENYDMLKNPYGLRIEYNASSLSPTALKALMERGVEQDRIYACHNFYPQRYTGLRWDQFCTVNASLAELGIHIGAFISSQAPGTHGVWDARNGLPTVERMRSYPADLQARLICAAGTTDVLFGNAYASDAELEAVACALEPITAHYTHAGVRPVVDEITSSSGTLLQAQHKVRVEPLYDLSEVEREILFEFYPHVDMGDSSEWIWRTRLPRLFYTDRVIEPRRYEGAEFPAGSVVMVNDNYRHYAGEIQVVLRPIVNDGTRNLIARIGEQELTMFDVIADGDVVVFIPR